MNDIDELIALDQRKPKKVKLKGLNKEVEFLIKPADSYEATRFGMLAKDKNPLAAFVLVAACVHTLDGKKVFDSEEDVKRLKPKDVEALFEEAISVSQYESSIDEKKDSSVTIQES